MGAALIYFCINRRTKFYGRAKSLFGCFEGAVISARISSVHEVFFCGSFHVFHRANPFVKLILLLMFINIAL